MSNFPNKNIWGPSLWNIIHILSTKYKNNSQTQLFKNIYLNILPNTLPCPICADHYYLFFNNLNFNPYNFEVKLYDFHNDVSIKNRKRPSYDYQYYSNIFSSQNYTYVFKMIERLKSYYSKFGLYNQINALNRLKNIIISYKNIFS